MSVSAYMSVGQCYSPVMCGGDNYSPFSSKDQNVTSARFDRFIWFKQLKVNQILQPSGVNQAEDSVVVCGKILGKVFAGLLVTPNRCWSLLRATIWCNQVAQPNSTFELNLPLLS